MQSHSETLQSENSLEDHRSEIIGEDKGALDKVIVFWCGLLQSEILIHKQCTVLTFTSALKEYRHRMHP